MLHQRIKRLQKAMCRENISMVLLSVGADLPYFTGYEAMPLERLTAFCVGQSGTPTLIVPELEAPRVNVHENLFSLIPWKETQDPLDLVGKQIEQACNGGAITLAVDDRLWSRFLIDLLVRFPTLTLKKASEITGSLRQVKDMHERHMLEKAGSYADSVASELQQGTIRLVGRTEKQVSEDIAKHLLELGHDRINFSLVAAGENSASPHHEPTNRYIEKNEVVWCDFGGAVRDSFGVPYCSDITRCFYTGDHIPSEVLDIYTVLHDAQQEAVAAVIPGVSGAYLDGIARTPITHAGYGDYFVHRTGHGIGVEEHEEPYIVATNAKPLVSGNAFSLEPGIYIPKKFGFRIEDIVIAVEGGVVSCNNASHVLTCVG